MKGIRGALATVLGLAFMQLLLSSSQGEGKTAGLVAAAWQYPAALLHRITDPSTPAIPDLSSSTPVQLASAPSSGLAGTGTPAGTGSSLINV